MTKGPIQRDYNSYFTLNIAWGSVHVLMYQQRWSWRIPGKKTSPKSHRNSVANLGLATKAHTVCGFSKPRTNRAGSKSRRASRKVTTFGIKEEQLKNQPEIQLLKEVIHTTLIVSSPYACNNFDKHFILPIIITKIIPLRAKSNCIFQVSLILGILLTCLWFSLSGQT